MNNCSRSSSTVLLLASLLFVSVVAVESLVSSRNVTNNASSSTSLSLIDYYNIRNNSLRKGFEPFFFLTNSFVDLIKPNDLKDIFGQNVDSLQQLMSLSTAKFNLEANTQNYAYMLYKVSGRLTVLILVSLALAIVLPIIGFFLCSYRTCCRAKPEPFDGKNDSLKRKINAFFIFIFLVTILLAIVVLFFTNQNSSMVVPKVPLVANSTLNQLESFLKNDATMFLKKTSQHLSNTTSDLDVILRETMQRSFLGLVNIQTSLGDYFQASSSSLTKISDLMLQLNSDPSLDPVLRNNLVQALQQLQITNQTLTTDSILLKQVLPDHLERDMLTKFVSAIQEVTQLIDQQDEIINPMIDLIHNASHSLNSESSRASINTGITYYRYFFYILMIACIFVLTLFLLFSLGLAGMCSRRKHSGYKQTCHRGLSSKCFLAAVGLFFLLAFIFILMGVVLFIVGISARHMVCKPLIELEDDPVFVSFKNMAEIRNVTGGLSFKKLINHCTQMTNDSDFAVNIFKKYEDLILENEQIVFTLGDLSNEPIFHVKASDLDQFKLGLSMIAENIKRTNDNLKKTSDAINLIPKVASADNTQSKILSDIRAENNILQASVNEFDLKNPIVNLIKDETNPDKVNLMIHDKLNQTIVRYTTVAFKQLYHDKFRLIIKSLPSCKVIPDIYGELVVTGCYEYLDNFNTFWFTLLVVIIIFLIMIPFSLSQADLFRKNYSYDEILAVEEIDDYKNTRNSERSNGYDSYQSKHSSKPREVIDAYDANGHNGMARKYPDDQRMKNSANIKNSTPPPKYKGSRA